MLQGTKIGLEGLGQTYLLTKYHPYHGKILFEGYSGDLNTGLVWYSNDRKLSDPQMVRYSNAI